MQAFWQVVMYVPHESFLSVSLQTLFKSVEPVRPLLYLAEWPSTSVVHKYYINNACMCCFQEAATQFSSPLFPPWSKRQSMHNNLVLCVLCVFTVFFYRVVLCVRACVCVCVCAHVCMCVSMHVCVCMHLCVDLNVTHSSPGFTPLLWRTLFFTSSSSLQVEAVVE